MFKYMKLMMRLVLGLCLSICVYAQQEVKIGVIYSLTGPGASTGAEMKERRRIGG